MPRRIHYTYTRPGKETGTYEHRLVVDRPELKVMLMEDYRGRTLEIDGRIVAEPGSALLWFVEPDRWHDIGRFYLADGTFTGWYTNFCTPLEIDGDRWASTDLFLDHWLWPTGGRQWLDEDELAAAIHDGLLDEMTQTKIADERVFIQSRLDAGDWPPRAAREMDLTAARGLIGS